MRLEPYTLAVGLDTSANFISPSNQVEHMGMGSVVAIFTGSPAGTLKLQGSHDNVNFADLGISQVVSASGNVMLRIPSIDFRYVLAVWTGSGTGAVTLTLFAKGF